MKQIRIKSGTCPSYLMGGKWYDVIPDGSSDTLVNFIDDDGDEMNARINGCANLGGGTWEVREVKEESMKEHKISDEKLREIYNHPDICDEWKDRIKEAVPTFKVEEKWVDITKDIKWWVRNVSGGYDLMGSYGDIDRLLWAKPNGTVTINKVMKESEYRVVYSGQYFRVEKRGE